MDVSLQRFCDILPVLDGRDHPISIRGESDRRLRVGPTAVGRESATGCVILVEVNRFSTGKYAQEEESVKKRPVGPAMRILGNSGIRQAFPVGKSDASQGKQPIALRRRNNLKMAGADLDVAPPAIFGILTGDMNIL